MVDAISLFWQFRLSSFFLLLFLFFFLPLGYKKSVSALLLLGSFTLTGTIDYICFIGMKNPGVPLPVTFLEIFITQATPLIVCKYRDFRALFVGITASAYVLAGNIFGTLADIFGAGLFLCVMIQLVIHIGLLAFFYWKIRENFREILENTTIHWGAFCTIPALFYTIVYAITMWPASIYKNPENMLGAVCVLALLVTSYMLIFEIFGQTKKDGELRQNMQYLEAYAQSLKHEADLVQEKEYEAAVLRHDTKHYALLINSYLDEGKPQEIRVLMEELDFRMQRTKPVRYCENLAINSVIVYSVKQAEKKGIRFEVKIEIPQKMNINEFEFATVVANLLENAINAAGEVKDKKKRYINLKAHVVKGQIIMEVKNSFEILPEISKKTGLPVSKRGDGHGYGMQSIQAFAEKNHALFDYSVNDGEFSVRLLVKI